MFNTWIKGISKSGNMKDGLASHERGARPRLTPPAVNSYKSGPNLWANCLPAPDTGSARLRAPTEEKNIKSMKAERICHLRPYATTNTTEGFLIWKEMWKIRSPGTNIKIPKMVSMWVNVQNSPEAFVPLEDKGKSGPFNLRYHLNELKIWRVEQVPSKYKEGNNEVKGRHLQTRKRTIEKKRGSLKRWAKVMNPCTDWWEGGVRERRREKTQVNNLCNKRGLTIDPDDSKRLREQHKQLWWNHPFNDGLNEHIS